MIGYQILVADPNPLVRKLLTLVLEASGHRLTFASDGEEALGLAIVDPPALVIAELRLDRLDGAALCEQLKSHPRTSSAKLLFLTTSTSKWDLRRAKWAGADHYLTKPFSPKVLLQQVEELLAGTPVGWSTQHHPTDRGNCL